MLAVTTYRSGLLRRLSVLRMIMASATKMARRLDLRLWRITASDPHHFQRHARRHSNRTAGLRLVDHAPRVRRSGGRLYPRAMDD